MNTISPKNTKCAPITTKGPHCLLIENINQSSNTRSSLNSLNHNHSSSSDKKNRNFKKLVANADHKKARNQHARMKSQYPVANLLLKNIRESGEFGLDRYEI